jgi:hypothetical protein
MQCQLFSAIPEVVCCVVYFEQVYFGQNQGMKWRLKKAPNATHPKINGDKNPQTG